MKGKKSAVLLTAAAMVALSGTALAASNERTAREANTQKKSGEHALPAGLGLERVPGQSDSIYYIKAKHSGKCMTVYRASKARGAKVNQYACVGQKNQWWVVQYTTGSLWRITGYQSGLCLSVSGGSTKNGASLIQWSCTGAADQLFGWPRDGSLRPYHTGKCLDVRGGSTANNASIIQWTCNGNTNQKWVKAG
ncbi:RICIN domain-containing protein [Streptomyces smyrnaeus]|uniref:RICIN domain-containing protein n=1 Tax=Streptomyces smyrnaeus TaxID=1387713 RepID=UPI0033BA3B52